MAVADRRVRATPRRADRCEPARGRTRCRRDRGGRGSATRRCLPLAADSSASAKTRGRAGQRRVVEGRGGRRTGSDIIGSGLWRRFARDARRVHRRPRVAERALPQTVMLSLSRGFHECSISTPHETASPPRNGWCAPSSSAARPRVALARLGGWKPRKRASLDRARARPGHLPVHRAGRSPAGSRRLPRHPRRQRPPHAR